MFFYIIAGIAGGVCGGLVLAFLVVFFVRSRNIWYLDGVATNWLTAPVIGPSAVVNLMFNFREKLTANKIKDLWNSFFLKNHIWTNRVIKRSFLWSYMEKDPDFSIERHIVEMPDPVTMNDIKIFFQQHVNVPLEYDRPLWKVYYFDNIIDTEGNTKSVMYLRYHHCLADGFSFLRLIFKASDFYQTMPIKSPYPSPIPSSSPSPIPSSSPIPSVSSLKSIPAPPSIHINGFKRFFLYLPTFFKLLSYPQDKVNPIKTPDDMKITDPRICDYKKMSISVDKIKHFKQLGYSVNDVLSSCIVGALRRFFDNKDVSFNEKQKIHGYLWMSMKPIQTFYTPIADDKVNSVYGNKSLSLLILSLPFKAGNSWERLELLTKEIHHKGKSAEPICVNHAMRLIGSLPRGIANSMFENLTRISSISISTVPASNNTIRLMDTVINDIIFSVPPTASIHTFCTLTSYNNMVYVTFCTDASLFTQEEVAKILECYDEELIDLYNIACSKLNEMSIEV